MVTKQKRHNSITRFFKVMARCMPKCFTWGPGREKSGADGEINLASIIHLMCFVWRQGL